MDSPITVLITDDHELVRESLSNRLSAEPEIDVVGAVASADEAITATLNLQPRVVLMDIDMPGRHPFDATRTIKARKPDIAVLFLSAFLHDHYIEEAIRCEASGYVTKNESTRTVIAAIRTAATGEVFFSPQVQSRLVVDARGVTLAKPRTRISLLSPRELEVLRYIARGLSKKEIAGAMHISVKTVDNHSTSLMSKLDLHDRVDLTRFAIREGLATA